MDLYAAGRSYEAEMLSEARARARHWQFFGLGGVAVGVIGLLVAAATVRLHTVTAHVVTVDKATGAAEVVNVTQMRDIPMQGIEAEAWVKRYVECRERYFYGVLQMDYDTVVGMSDDPVTEAYDADIRPKEKAVKATADEYVAVRSIQLPPDQPGRATVRFEKRVVSQGRPASSAQPKVYTATLAYRFVPNPIGKRETLQANPLGFKVSAYVVQAELGDSR